MKWCKLDKRHMALYIELTILSLLYVFPVILADRYYDDDLARSLYGLTGWKGDGRPLGEWLILLLYGGQRPITDIAPLPLIAAILILSYALTLYAKKNFDLFPHNYLKVPVLLFIITNPLAMSNLSYRFDSIIMLSALSVPFMIYAIPDQISGIVLALCSFLAGVVIMSVYQPAIGMCIVLFIINILIFIMYGRNRIRQDCFRMGGIGAGAIMYALVIAPHYVDKEGWRYEASQMISNLSAESIQTVTANVKNVCTYIKNYMSGTPKLYLGILAITIAIAWGMVLTTYFRKSKTHGWLKAAGGICLAVSPVIVFAASWLPLVVLRSLAMRSRLFLSFGGFLFFIGILWMYLANEKKVLQRIVPVLLILCCFFQYTLMYAYGNALKSQKEYEKYMVYSIVHDLETLNGKEDFMTFSLEGDVPRARQLQMMCVKYPFFNEIVPVYFTNDTWIGGVWLYHYMQDELKIDQITEEDLSVISSEDPVLNNSLYSCYLNGKKIIVSFHS